MADHQTKIIEENKLAVRVEPGLVTITKRNQLGEMTQVMLTETELDKVQLAIKELQYADIRG